MTPQGYSDAFWWVACILGALFVFWLGIREDLADPDPDPAPTEDTTKTRRLP